MNCKACASDRVKDFTAEVAIHFPGVAGLTKPLVQVFPGLIACLDCGFVEFVVTGEQLEQLGQKDPPDGLRQ